MARLEHIPNELLRDIVMFVGFESIKDLAAISLQNRRFHQLADMETRKRFHQITITGKRHDIVVLANIVQDISMKKILGSYVQEVEVLDSGVDGIHSIPGFEYNNKAVVDFLSSELLPHDPMLEMALDGPTLNKLLLFAATIATLFSLCPKIQRLAIPRAPLGLWVIIASLPRKDQWLPPMLQGLRAVELSYLRWRKCALTVYQPFDFRHVLLLLYRNRSIQSVHIEGVALDKCDEYLLPVDASSIKKFHLKHSFVVSTILVEVIGHFKTLEEFSYTCDGIYPSIRTPMYIHPNRLLDVLYFHRFTLKVLDLDLRLGLIALPVFATTTRKRLVDSRLGSLEEFTALTHLSIDIDSLLIYNKRDLCKKPGTPKPLRLVEMLPRGLEYLYIREYKPGEDKLYDKNILQFLKEKDQLFPRLKEIHGISEYVPGIQRIEFPGQGPTLFME